jgi:hypothetical protein
MDWKVNPLVAEKAQAAKFSFVRARPLAKKTASLIKKETVAIAKISLKRHSGEARNPVTSANSGCRIRYPGLDPGPA